MSEETVGFIGLGLMGGAIAMRMLKSGRPLIVHDIDAESLARFVAAGAVQAGSVREIADRCSLVMVCLPTGGFPDVAREAAEGAALQVYAEFSTMRPETAREIEAIMATQGKMLVDAPVSGGVTIAERGALSLMMAGPAEAMDRLEAAMAPVIAHAFRVGDTPGQAQLCKLVNNAIGFTMFVASCEALSVGAAGGIDPVVLLEAANAGTARNSWTTDKFGPHVLSRSFDAGGKLGGGPRALDLYLDQAEAAGMPPGLVARTRAVWAAIAAKMDPSADFTTMIRHFEGLVGAELRG
ncbi:MAG TPA: NAD(P)-dependent oxidoreductase [Allosphingosinicella sp.]|nr:NAD(P)-dependent oxidoreductase [Allosphingosinicella sp.]